MTAMVAGGGGVKVPENKSDNVVFVLHTNPQLMPIGNMICKAFGNLSTYLAFVYTGHFPALLLPFDFFQHSKIAILCPLFWVVRCTINSCFYILLQ